MDDLIEKCARAICEAEPFTESGREEYWLRHKHVYSEMARAVVDLVLEEAAKVATSTRTLEWNGGDEWAAGYVDGKTAAAAAIRSLSKGGE